MSVSFPRSFVDDYELNRLRADFDSLLPAEIVEYLDDKRKGQLQTDFVADWLDADDREVAIFNLIDRRDRDDLASRLEGSWLRFLDRTFENDKQGDLAESAFQNFVEQNQ